MYLYSDVVKQFLTRLCFPCTREWLEIIITGGGAIRQMMHRLSTSGADVDKVIVVNSGLSSMAMGIGEEWERGSLKEGSKMPHLCQTIHKHRTQIQNLRMS